MLRLSDVTFSYGSHKALDSISLECGGGSCLVAAGPNGSGKSTLLSVISGARKPCSGSVSVGGRVGFVPQGTALLEDVSVSDNVKFFSSVCNVKAAPLGELPFSLKSIASRRVSSLSVGMKKRVSIACALASKPDILVLDEPCASLDILYREELLELICSLKRDGMLIVYAGHDFNEISLICDKMLLLKDGKAVFYKEKNLLPANPLELEKLVRANLH